MQSTNERETNDSEGPESESEDGGSKLAGRDGDEGNRPSPTMNGGLFKDEANRAINFFIHDSVKKAHVIQKLTEDITKHGGRVVKNVEHALIVLVARDYTSGKQLQASYEAARHADVHRIYVKPTPFVMKCIQRNQLYLHEEERRPMRGFPPGRRRNSFTSSDDENLCYYLSRVTPNKEAGGRSGYNIYKQLVSLAQVNPNHCSWAGRHTVESWRGRYKNQKAKMDQIIDEMAEKDPPTHKQLWREDRRLNKQRRGRYIDISDSEEEFLEDEGQNSEQEEGDDDRVQQVRGSTVTNNIEKRRQNKKVQSQYQEPPSKRPRIDRPEPSSSQKRKSAKGKERAVEEEFTEPALYTLEDEEEPPDPGRTLVPTHTDAPPSSNFRTQDTLVPSTSQNDDRIHHDSYGLPIPSAWSPIQIPAELPTLADTSSRSAPALTTSPSNRGQSANKAGPAPSFPQSKPISLPTPQPTNTAYQRPRMAARRPKDFMRPSRVDDSEPVRNTPWKPQRLPAVLSPQTRKTIQKETVDDPEAEQRSPVASHVLNRLREFALEDENDNVGQTVYGYGGERASSMDTDDAETKQNLSGRSKASTSLDTDPSEILERLQTQSSVRGSSLLAPRTPRRSLQSPNRAPVTPRHWGTASDSSSVESFPASGTKASAMKRQLQQHEKHTPYKPPEGTRAALLAQQPPGHDPA